MSEETIISRGYYNAGKPQSIRVEDIGFITDAEHPLYDVRVKRPANPGLGQRLIAEGQLDAIHVFKGGKDFDKKFIAYVGIQRTKAAGIAGIQTLDARVADLDKVSFDELRNVAIVSNAWRDDDGLMERATQVSQQVEAGVSFKALATLFNQKEQTLRRLAWFAECPFAKDLAKWVSKNLLSETDAINLSGSVRALDEKGQAAAFKKISAAVEATESLQVKLRLALEEAAAIPTATKEKKVAEKKVAKIKKEVEKTAKKEVQKAVAEVREVEAPTAKAKPAVKVGGHPQATFAPLSIEEVDDIIFNPATPAAVSTTLQVVFGIVDRATVGVLPGCAFLGKILK